MIINIDLSFFIADTLQIQLKVLRLDSEDVIAGGNKSYKLKYNIEEARNQNKKCIVTLGGAFSNHIAAVARQCKRENLKSVGIIRGDDLLPRNITLKRAEEDGMKLIFVSRKDYRELRTTDETLLQSLINPLLEQNTIDTATCYLVPEGGNNRLGFKGCREILNQQKADYDFVCCAAGTGTTLAGLAASIKPHQTAVGIAAVKDYDFINNNISTYLSHDHLHGTYKLIMDYTFGGFGKSNAELRDFTEEFSTRNSIAIEPVYTGKMFYGILQMIKKGEFPEGSNILCVHTGGLQYLQP